MKKPMSLRLRLTLLCAALLGSMAAAFAAAPCCCNAVISSHLS